MNAAPQKIRTLFLSDLHIGHKKFDAAALVKFLSTVQPEFIYLVGDIIDGWKLDKRWYWTRDCTRLLDTLIDHRNRGAKIVYLPGNHDEKVRSILPFRALHFAKKLGIELENMVTHVTAANKKFTVLHGDQFDIRLIRGPVSRISDRVYDWFTDWLGRPLKHTPDIVIKGKTKRFSLAKHLYNAGARTSELLYSLDRVIARFIKHKKTDGLICGHTHAGGVRILRRNNTVYANSGMWMGDEHGSLIEHTDGRMEYVTIARETFDKAPTLTPQESVYAARHQETVFIIKSIRQIWADAATVQDLRNNPHIRIERLKRFIAELSTTSQPAPDHTAPAPQVA